MNKLEQIFIDSGVAWEDDAKRDAIITKEIVFKYLDWLEQNHNLVINQHSGEYKYFLNGALKTKDKVFQEFLKTL